VSIDAVATQGYEKPALSHSIPGDAVINVSRLAWVLLAVGTGLPMELFAQADSVRSSTRRTDSSIRIFQDVNPPDGAGWGRTDLLFNVPIKSQDGNFVRELQYGPFNNSSDATLTISLNHRGGSPSRSVAGYVNGVIAGSGGASLTFEVPPNSTYFFSVRDAFFISAKANKNNLPISQTGLPSKSDFESPTGGVYASCENLYDGKVIYYYQPGSRSDRSSRTDSFDPPEPRSLVGECTQPSPIL
jgi:hypothetical protein